MAVLNRMLYPKIMNNEIIVFMKISSFKFDIGYPFQFMLSLSENFCTILLNMPSLRSQLALLCGLKTSIII